MSEGIEFFCSPEEFWEKMRDALAYFRLSCFRRHQSTGQIVPVPLTEIDRPIEWLWDLWAATAIPRTEFCKELPAKGGWILIKGPEVTLKREIGICRVTVKTDWLDDESRQILKNDDLSRLFEKLRRRLHKGIITNQTTVKFANGVSRNFPIRYTKRALSLQDEDWVFVKDGSIYKLAEE